MFVFLYSKNDVVFRNRESKNFRFFCPLFLVMFMMPVIFSEAQTGSDSSETYVQRFPDHITSRIYMSRKYTGFNYRDKNSGELFRFRPNTTHNLGVGATYDWLTLNLAYGFGFMNPDVGRGETNYLDLQGRAYPEKFVLDFYGQFYRGYHLLPEGTFAPEENSFYSDPNIRVRKVGASFQFLSNPERFSYRAAFHQNEWQKKSAGTFLYGFEMYGGSIRSDNPVLPESAMIPMDRNFRSMTYFEFGPNAGAAYTLVVKKHFFLTVSGSTNLGIGFNTLEGENFSNTRWSITPNLLLRAFAGYNSEIWSINANYVYNNVRLASNSGFNHEMMTGNYRVNFVYRIEAGPKFKAIFEKYNPFNFIM